MPSVSSSRGKPKSIDFEKEISTALTSIPKTNEIWSIPLVGKDLERLEKGRIAVESSAQKAIKKWVIKALSTALAGYYTDPSKIEGKLFEKPDFGLQYKSTSIFVTLVPFPVDQPKYETDLFSGKKLYSSMEGMKKSPKKLNQFNYWYIPIPYEIKRKKIQITSHPKKVVNLFRTDPNKFMIRNDNECNVFIQDSFLLASKKTQTPVEFIEKLGLKLDPFLMAAAFAEISEALKTTLREIKKTTVELSLPSDPKSVASYITKEIGDRIKAELNLPDLVVTKTAKVNGVTIQPVTPSS
ncbi:MAG: hypothetical protein ACW976_02110, partial [Candidatus Ranarchaeia archaeon]